ncbi:alpha/beta-hydrolase [Ascodesmis nigricans]|uniref:Alpha/beta-hydrolase n=1 Tax=Ascodesmis nigricans TaxID=341454 RepID=A0A4S2N0R8_9PEZI|nr:alpha/beta-hydrolase [Ascodesmis nigricans]
MTGNINVRPRASILRTLIFALCLYFSLAANIDHSRRSAMPQSSSSTVIDPAISVVDGVYTSASTQAFSPNAPVIFFVPGAWHHYDFFAKVRVGLSYPSDTTNHPSIGAYPPTLDLNDDIANLRAALLAHINAGKQVVVVLHSYGGIVGSSAAHQLSYKYRQTQGLPGGIITLVYISAFVVPAGNSIRDMLPGGQWNPWMKFEGDLSFTEDEENIFYHDLSAAEKKYWVSRLRHHSLRAYEVKVGVNGEGWLETPSMYVYCEQDQAVPLVVQQAWKNSMGPGVATFSINASHSPFISQPAKVREAIAAAITFGRQESGITV